MALLWCDGFDHYGSDENNMLDGVYAQVAGQLSTTRSATGTHSFFMNSDGSLNSQQGPRKVLPTSKTKMGVCGRFYFEDLPNDNDTAFIFDFLSSTSTRSQLAACVDSNGAIRFYRGSNHFTNGSIGTLVATSDPIIVASAWNHIEIQVNIDNTTGWVRVAVNGVHRYEATGLDTQHDGTGILSVCNHRPAYGGAATDDNSEFYMDDIIYYDFVGDDAVDTDFCPPVDVNGVATGYIGELQVMYLPPNGDTVEDDWTPSTGSDAYAMVDETTPNDSDYITSTTAGDLTELDLTDLPEDITYIRGLQLLGRLSKSDSGAAMTKFGMNSDGTTDDADERPVTVEPTYWWDFMNVDPDSLGRWTRDSLNAAKFRLTRSV